ncbi:hypothetical protein BH09MYX1_BH09MYX1_40080 [soil metagenome]
MIRFAFFAVAAIALFGCGPSDHAPTTVCSAEASPPPDGKAIARLGYGTNGPFQPISDGAVLTIDHGSQGGKHVWVSIQSFMPEKSTVVFSLTLSTPDGTVVAKGGVTANACGKSWITATNQRVIFEDSYGPVPDGTLTLKVVANDGVGTSVSQSLSVTLQP